MTERFGAIGNLPILLIGGLFFLFRRSSNIPGVSQTLNFGKSAPASNGSQNRDQV